MSEEANTTESEPIQDRIARAIKESLEPFVVSVLAALISPTQCAQGIDSESEDQRRKAIEIGRMLLHETRTSLGDSYDRIERYRQELEVQKQQQYPPKDWLYLNMKLGDDSFRAYLREQKAPRKIQDREAIAHFRALSNLGLGGLLPADRAADGDLFGYRIRKRVADDYLKSERQASSNAAARSREKSAKEKRENKRHTKSR